MDIGLSLPVAQQVPAYARSWESAAGPAEITKVARAAEELGFAWIACSDHVAVPQSRAAEMGRVWYEPVAMLGYLAAATQRVRLLAHVMVLPYRHPLLLAKAFATLDRLSGGRIILGAGVGHLKGEFAALGLDFGGREERSEEALAALAAALEQEMSSYAGKFFAWRDMIVAPRCVQRPRLPLWVGGNGVRAVRRAALQAEGWIPWRVDRERFGRLVALGNRLAREAGRNQRLEFVAPVAVGRAQSRDELRSCIEAWGGVGATAVHARVDHRDLDELLDRMALVAEVARAIVCA